MSGELSPNAQAILLLTAPLLAGRTKRSGKPLSLGEYQGLARHLYNTGKQPADLLDAAALKELDDSGCRLDTERLRRLLERGFLLAQVLERWRARGIWVVTRADADYPLRLKKRMRAKAPPVLYGCGDRGAMEKGGLAVVGSRNVNDELIQYTEGVGQLAAATDIAIVSGGARGVDQAAMRGALEADGRAVGVLANGLDRAALRRENRNPLMDGRLVLLCPYDPAVRFLTGYAMQRNKLIYAMADAALVVNSDHGHGGTWAGATEQLEKFHFVPVFVRGSGEPSDGLDALASRGALPWPDPQTPGELCGLVGSDAIQALEPVSPVQQDLFAVDPAADRRETAVRESAVVAAREYSDPAENLSASMEATAPQAVKAGRRLLPVMTGEMTRREILEALGLRDRGNLKRVYLDPCLREGWVEMTNPDKPTSRKQRFLLTATGHRWRELLNG